MNNSIQMMLNNSFMLDQRSLINNERHIKKQENQKQNNQKLLQQLCRDQQKQKKLKQMKKLCEQLIKQQNAIYSKSGLILYSPPSNYDYFNAYDDNAGNKCYKCASVCYIQNVSAQQMLVFIKQPKNRLKILPIQYFIEQQYLQVRMQKCKENQNMSENSKDIQQIKQHNSQIINENLQFKQAIDDKIMIDNVDKSKQLIENNKNDQNQVNNKLLKLISSDNMIFSELCIQKWIVAQAWPVMNRQFVLQLFSAQPNKTSDVLNISENTIIKQQSVQQAHNKLQQKQQYMLIWTSCPYICFFNEQQHIRQQIVIGGYIIQPVNNNDNIICKNNAKTNTCKVTFVMQAKLSKAVSMLGYSLMHGYARSLYKIQAYFIPFQPYQLNDNDNKTKIVSSSSITQNDNNKVKNQ